MHLINFLLILKTISFLNEHMLIELFKTLKSRTWYIFGLWMKVSPDKDIFANMIVTLEDGASISFDCTNMGS